MFIILTGGGGKDLIDSWKLKEAALNYLRFEKQMPWIATEFGNYSADVIGANSERMIEIEVKISKSDFMHDFQKPKHHYYVNSRNELPSWRAAIPNLFFYLVPVFLEVIVVETVVAKDLKYGVMVYDSEPSIENGHGVIRVAKRAKRLHEKVPEHSTLEAIARRMSSELVGMYRLRNRFENLFDTVLQQAQKRSDTVAIFDKTDCYE